MIKFFNIQTSNLINTWSEETKSCSSQAHVLKVQVSKMYSLKPYNDGT